MACYDGPNETKQQNDKLRSHAGGKSKGRPPLKQWTFEVEKVVEMIIKIKTKEKQTRWDIVKLCS